MFNDKSFKNNTILVTVFFILLLNIVNSKNLFGQSILKLPNWQNLDLQHDKYFGTSTEKAYQLLLKDMHPEMITVAIIDGGVDINHPDLSSKIWTNPKEKPRNKKDDDHNGYVDDINGWNYMGTGKNSFQVESAALVRDIRMEQSKGGSDKLNDLLLKLTKKRASLTEQYNKSSNRRLAVEKIVLSLGKNPTLEQLKAYQYKDEAELEVLIYIVQTMKGLNQSFEYFYEDLVKQNEELKTYLDQAYSLGYNPRSEEPTNSKKPHGNADVIGNDPSHGTHVAGILAAERGNGIGLDGVAAPARLMVLRAIPVGDIVDEDFAAAITYAADNGAKVINLSAGSKVTTARRVVDDAVKYAMAKDVLIVHSSGNEGMFKESESNFPNRHYLDGGVAEAWLEVGASGPYDDETLLPWFSNYGKSTVDVFAPGLAIYSTWPGNTYRYENGTSMAAPVVSGLAVLIRAYYPKLSALQVKDIIMKSVTKVNHTVRNKRGESLKFSELCASGGIINAYSALLLAKDVNGALLKK